MPEIETIRFIATQVFIVLMMTAFMTDLLTMRIFNSLNALIFSAFVAAALAMRMPIDVFAASIGLGLLGFAVGYVLFCLNAMGGGDVKFIAATLPWFGWNVQAMDFALWFSIYGGILTLFLLFARQFPLPVFAYRYEWITRLHQPKGEVPYGLAMSVVAIQMSGAILKF